MNPAILNLINMTSLAARESRIPLSLCGEIAGDPLWTALLLGLDIHVLSMNSASIPLIKRSIRLLRKEDCQRAAHHALRAGSSAEVKRIMSRFEKVIQSQVLFHPEQAR